MISDKLKLIKQIIIQQRDSFDLDKEIEKNETMLDNIRETSADEFSFSGNIELSILLMLQLQLHILLVFLLRRK